jgi:hypothetical protein
MANTRARPLRIARQAAASAANRHPAGIELFQKCSRWFPYGGPQDSMCGGGAPDACVCTAVCPDNSMALMGTLLNSAVSRGLAQPATLTMSGGAQRR